MSKKKDKKLEMLGVEYDSLSENKEPMRIYK